MPRPFLQLLLALTLILAASYYWQASTDPAADSATSARRRSLPQSYLETTRSWSYSREGMLANILEAERAEYFSAGQETVLQAPRFYAHNGDDKTWSAAAATGRFDHRSETLVLDEDAVLVHDQSGGRLETGAITIDVNARVATSTAPVTLTQGFNRTSARGMVANLEDETILMTPNVESTYVPPSL